MTRIQDRCFACIELAPGKEWGITTAVVVAAFGAICVAGVLVALWAPCGGLRDKRVAGERSSRSTARSPHRRAALGSRRSSVERARAGLDAIGSTIDLGEVLHEALAAAEALQAVDGAASAFAAPTAPSRPRPAAA